MNVRARGHRSAFYLVVILMAVGMSLVWYSTVWGAGLISDSFQYTASARNVARGNGFSLPYGDGELEPMTKYPPMYSVVLAVFELIGIRALQGARVVNILLFGISIFLVYLSIQKLTRSSVFALLASLLFASSFVLVEVHSWALSEPLYICLGLAAFLLLQNYFEEARGIWLILAALAVSLAFLTRYVGFSLVVSIALLLLVNHTAIKQRLKNVLLFLTIALLPAALWTLRGYLLTQTLNDRTLGFYPLTVKNYLAAIDVLYGWLFPVSIVQGEEKIFLAVTVAAFAGFLWFLIRFYKSSITGLVKKPNPQAKIVLLHSLYFVFYGLMIIASKTWIDPDIGLSDRILSPMLVSLLILLVVFFSFLWKNFLNARPFVALACLGLALYYAAGTFMIVRTFYESGIGIARRGWHRSEVIQSLRSYPSFSIYTNSNSSLYLWSDRSGYGIPEFEQLKETGTDRQILLVIFHHVPPTGKRLNELIRDLELLGADRIVSVYALGPE